MISEAVAVYDFPESVGMSWDVLRKHHRHWLQSWVEYVKEKQHQKGNSK